MSDVDLNAVCREAIASNEPILLVGQSRDELETAAQRIHEIAQAGDSTCRFGTVQCQGLPVDRVKRQTIRKQRRKPFTAFRVRRAGDGQDDTHSDYDVVDETRPSWLDHQFMVHQTLYLADVDRASDEVAWAILEAVKRDRPRVVASTTVAVDQWTHNPLLEFLRKACRIRVPVLSDGPTRHVGGEEAGDSGFSHSGDYGEVALHGTDFELNSTEACIIQMLHEAWQSDALWVSREQIKERLHSRANPLRVRDCFRSPETYDGLVIRSHRGIYRLKISVGP